MYEIEIKHRGQGLVVYTVYRRNEAEEDGIKFKYWKEASEGDYAVSDDDYIAKVIKKRSYIAEDGRTSVYMRFPRG